LENNYIYKEEGYSNNNQFIKNRIFNQELETRRLNIKLTNSFYNEAVMSIDNSTRKYFWRVLNSFIEYALNELDSKSIAFIYEESKKIAVLPKEDKKQYTFPLSSRLEVRIAETFQVSMNLSNIVSALMVFGMRKLKETGREITITNREVI